MVNNYIVLTTGCLRTCPCDLLLTFGQPRSLSTPCSCRSRSLEIYDHLELPRVFDSCSVLVPSKLNILLLISVVIFLYIANEMIIYIIIMDLYDLCCYLLFPFREPRRLLTCAFSLATFLELFETR